MTSLNVPEVVCNQCNAPITTSYFVKCQSCKKSYHFNPCTVLSESTYGSMSNARKASWKCQMCKPRDKSPNNIFIYNENQQPLMKQQREDDDASDTEGNKRFRDSSTNVCGSSTNNTTTMIANPNLLQSDVTELKSDMKELKTTMQQFAANMISLHTELKEQLSSAIIKINETLSSLSSRVNDLNERDREKTTQITEIDQRINKLEQIAICKNIEINNVCDTNIESEIVIKKIAASVGTELCDADISSAYRIKRNNKIIVEFSSLAKKRQLMSKINRRRVDANVLSENTSNPANSFIYVNDELTPRNRRLLWMSKTKAKECGWKFVWVRNGVIYARKNENSSAIVIINATDIETITQIN